MPLISPGLAGSGERQPGLGPLLRLAETLLYQFLERIECGSGILAIGFEPEAGALGCGQHHDTHDALGIDALRIPVDVYFGTVAIGNGDELAGRTGMQAELVDDGDISADHCASAMVMQLRAPSVAALATPVWC